MKLSQAVLFISALGLSHVVGVQAISCQASGEGFGHSFAQRCVRSSGGTEPFGSYGCQVKESKGYEFASPGDEVMVQGQLGTLTDSCTIAAATPTSYGDPHFKLWNGSKYDFHGGCDLVLLQNAHFSNGLGLNIHIRTKIQSWWSFIEAAVVQIGTNTLEVVGGKESIQYRFNGEADGQELETAEASLGDFEVHFTRINEHQSRTRLDLGNGDAVSIETFKDFVRVNVKAKTPGRFAGSVGLLGSYPEGKMMARDGVTVMEHADEFGQEWQVRPSEGSLFHDAKSVESPLQCPMPDKTLKKEARRRLGESAIKEEEAEVACARVKEEDRDACVFDVLATNDKDMAGSY